MSDQAGTVTGSDEVAVQTQAIERGCALVTETRRGMLEVTGRDRARFLHGLCTVDVKRLSAGAGAYGYITAAKGQILADVVIRAREDSLGLDLPLEEVVAVQQHLTKYVVVDDVGFEIPSGVSRITIAGPQAEAVLRPLIAAQELPAQPWGLGRITVDGAEFGVEAEPRSGAVAWSLSAEPQEVAALSDRLRARVSPVVVHEAGVQAWEVARVRAGIPRFGVDFGAENLPQEVAIPAAIDFEKGCYLGQEVIARLHYRGQASRWLHRVRIESGDRVEEGTALFCEGREAGRITSCVPDRSETSFVGLAMLDRRAAQEHAVVVTPDDSPVEARALETRFG